MRSSRRSVLILASASPARFSAGYECRHRSNHAGFANADALSLHALRRTAFGKSVLAAGFAALTFLYAAPLVQAFRAPAAVTPLASLDLPSFALPAFAVPRDAGAATAHHAAATLRPIAPPTHARKHLGRHRVQPKVVKLPVVSNKYDLAPSAPKKIAAPKAPTYTDTIGVASSDGGTLIPMPADPTGTSTKSGDAATTDNSSATSIPSTTTLASGDAVVAADSSNTVASPPPSRVRSLQGDPPAPSNAPAPLATVTVSTTTVDPTSVTTAPASTSSNNPVVNSTVATVSTPNTTPAPTVTTDQSTTGLTSATAGGTQTVDSSTATTSTSSTGNTTVTTSDPTTPAPAADTTTVTDSTAGSTSATSSDPNARGPPTLVSATTGGTVTSGDGKAQLTFAPGTLTTDLNVSITTTAPPATTGLTYVTPVYDFSATNASTGAVVDSFTQGPTLTIRSDSTISGSPTIYYVAADGTTTALVTSQDPLAHTSSAVLTHFSSYVAAVSDLKDGVPIVQATVSGTVLLPADAGGGGIDGVTLRGTSRAGYTVHVVTSGGGQFSIGVSRDTWTFTINQVPNYIVPDGQTVDTTTGSVSGLTFQLGSYDLYYTGVTKDSAGNPIGNVEVDNGFDKTTSDPVTGKFTIGGPSGSEWDLRGVDVPDYYRSGWESYYGLTTSYEYTFTPTANGTQDLTYTLMPRLVSGSFQDQNGGGVPNIKFRVYMYTTNGHNIYNETRYAGADGTYVIRTPADLSQVDIDTEGYPFGGYEQTGTCCQDVQVPSPDDGSNLTVPAITYTKHSTPVSGTVKLSDGTPVAGGFVYASFGGTNGYFTTYGLVGPDGTYTVYGENDEHVYLYAYDNLDGNCNLLAGYTSPCNNYLYVGDIGTGVTGQDLFYVAAATASGKVTKNDGTPVAGASVLVRGYTYLYTTTNSLGEYEGWLYVAPSGSSYGEIDLETPIPNYQRSPNYTSLFAKPGDSFTDENFTYTPVTKLYSGTAIDSFGANAPDGTTIHVVGSNGDEGVGTVTGGAWSVLGPDSIYRVYTDATDGYGSGSTYYPSTTTGIVVTLPTAFVKIVAGDDQSPAQPLAATFDVCGYYYCNYGYSWIHQFGPITTSADDGSYTLRVDPTQYSVVGILPHDLAKYLTPSSTYVYTQAGTTQTATFTFTRGAVITGRLVDDAGSAIPNAQIALDPWFNRYGVAASATTDANGVYIFTLNNASATTHSVEPFATSGYTKRFPGQDGGGAYQTGTVQNGTTLSLSDLVMNRNGSIGGTITDDLQNPIADPITVTTTYTAPWVSCTGSYAYYCTYGYTNAGRITYSATSNSDGLGVGHYTLSAPAIAGVVVHPTQVAHYVTPADALPVDVTTATLAPVAVDFQYGRRAIVTGTVSAKSGTLPDVVLRFYGYDGFCCGNDHYYQQTITIPAGSSTYQLEVPAGPGSYAYIDDNGNFVPGFGFAFTSSGGTNYYVHDLAYGDPSGFDWTWYPLAAISGHVADQDGKTLPSGLQAPLIRDNSYDAAGRWHQFTASAAMTDGSYTVGAFPSASNYVYVDTYENGYGRGGPATITPNDPASTSDHYANIDLTSGNATGIDFEYIKWVPISGTMFADDGNLPQNSYPYVSWSARDTWGHYYSDSLRAYPSGGQYTTIVPVGSVSFVGFQGISHYLSPSPSTIATTVNTPVTADFKWLHLATIFGSLRNGDGNAVGMCYPCHYVTIVGPGDPDVISQWIYLDPASLPAMIGMQFNTADDGSWDHRAYFGNNDFPWGTDGTTSRFRLGDLPDTTSGAGWYQLLIPTKLVGISGRSVGGIAWDIAGGSVVWGETELISGLDSSTKELVDGSFPSPNVAWGGDPGFADTPTHDGNPTHASSVTCECIHEHYYYGAPNPFAVGPVTYSAWVDWSGNYSQDVLPDSGPYTVIPPHVDPYGDVASVTGVAVTRGQQVRVDFLYSFVGTIQGHLWADPSMTIGIPNATVCDDRNDCSTSDAGGFYSFHSPIGTRVVSPQRFVVGYAVEDPSGQLTLATGDTITQDFTYGANGTVVGTALVNQLPLKGAKITFDYYDPLTNNFLYTYVAFSGDDGTYALSVPFGTGRTIVAHGIPHYTPLDPSSQTVDLTTGGQTPASADFAYEQNGALEGFLLWHTTGLAGSVTLSNGPGWFWWQTQTVQSDPTTGYLFDDLVPGTYHVSTGTITHFRAVPSQADVTIASGQTSDLNFLFTKLAHLTGHAQDDAGHALPNVSFYISSVDALGTTNDTFYVQTNLLGDFSTDVFPGTVTITPIDYAPNGISYSTPPAQTLTLAEGDDTSVPPPSPPAPFVFARYRTVIGLVEDSNGNAVHPDGNPGGTPSLWVEDPITHRKTFATILADGVSFQIAAPPTATIVHADNVLGYSGQNNGVINANGVSSTIVYLKDGHLALSVGDAYGGLAADYTVYKSGSPYRYGTTAGDGTARIQLPVGSDYSVTVKAAADHLAPAPDSQSFAIGAAADTAISFTERRFGQLHGFVNDDTGSALPNVWVYANNGYQTFAVLTQQDGSWSIRGPPTVGAQLYTVYVPVGPSFPHYATYQYPAATNTTLGLDGDQGNGSVEVDFTLTRFGEFTGGVSDSNGGHPPTTIYLQQNGVTIDSTNDSYHAGYDSSTGTWFIFAPQGSGYRIIPGDAANELTPSAYPAQGALSILPGQTVGDINFLYTSFIELKGSITNNDLPAGGLNGAQILFQGSVPTPNGATNVTRYATGDGNGAFDIFLPAGTYKVSPVMYFGYELPESQNITISPTNGCMTDTNTPFDCLNFDWTFVHGYVNGFAKAGDLGINGVTVQLKGVEAKTGHEFDSQVVVTANDPQTGLPGWYMLSAPPGDYGVVGGLGVNASPPDTPPTVKVAAGNAVDPLGRDIPYTTNGTLKIQAVDDLTCPPHGDVCAGIDGMKIRVGTTTLTTSGGGYVTFSLAPGTYVIAPNTDFGYDLPGAIGNVSVSSNAETDIFVHYTSALIKVYVTDSFNQPVDNVKVDATQNFVFYYAAITQGGLATMRVHTGTSSLTFSAPAAFTSPAAQNVTFAELDHSGAGFAPDITAVASNAWISGTITVDGVPTAGIDVNVVQGSGQGGNLVATAKSNSDGVYSTYLPTGSFFAIAVPPAGLTQPAALPVSGLFSGETRPNQDIAIATNGRVAVALTYEDGTTPVGGVDVKVTTLNGNGTEVIYSEGTTDSGGLVTLSTPAGAGTSFNVRFAHVDGLTRPADLVGLHLEGGSSTPANEKYLHDATASGIATDSFGNGVGDAWIVAHGPNGEVTWVQTADGSNPDAAAGTFSFLVPVGSTVLQGTNAQGYGVPIYTGPSPSVPTSSMSATLSLEPNGIFTGANFTYPDAQVVGLVADGILGTDPDTGLPIYHGRGGVAVLIDQLFGHIVSSDENGNFKALVAPDYLTVRPGSVSGFTRPAPFVLVGDNNLRIQAVAGTTYTVPVFLYTLDGSVFGHVYDQLGAGINNVHVFVNGPNGNNHDGYTDTNGYFTIAAAAGENKISVGLLPGRLTPDAQTVGVESSQATGPVDFSSRSGVLFGKVTDSNGNPLPDVTVTVAGAFLATTTTNADGMYQIVAGLGDNTLCVSDYSIGGVQLSTPDCQAAPRIPVPPTPADLGNPNNVQGPVNFTFGAFSTTPGSQLKITVEDAQTFAPLPNATVLVQVGNLQVTKMTDPLGRIRLAVDPGTYVAYAYLNGYTPVTQSVTAGVGVDENIVYLTNKQFVVGEVTVTRLTLDQILAKGIDVTDPANQQVFQFTAVIGLNVPGAPPPPPLVTYWNANGVPFFSGGASPAGGGGGATCTPEFGCSIDLNDASGTYTMYVKPIPIPGGERAFAYFVIPGKARFEKEFFDVNFHVVNTAPADWILSGSTATLSSADFVSLAPTPTPQSYTLSLGDIPGGTDKSVDWTVRGDSKGNYQPTVTFDSTLEPTGNPIELQFQAQNPIQIYGADAVKMTFDVPPAAIAPLPVDVCGPECLTIQKWNGTPPTAGDLERSSVPFVIRIGLTNTTDVPVYLPSVSLDGVEDPTAMQQAGFGVAIGTDGSATRPILLGFGEHVTHSWAQIDPFSTVWATYILIPPFGGTVDLFQSHIDTSDVDFHATVSVDGTLATGGDVSTTLGTLDAAAVPDGGIYLSWSAIPGATQYKLYRSTNRYFWDQSNLIGTFDASAGAFHDGDVQGSSAGTPYFYALETVFGNDGVHTDGESHVLTEIRPIVYTSSTGDTTPPVTTLTTDPANGPFDDSSTFSLAATDNSGVAVTYYSVDDGPTQTYDGPFQLIGLSGLHTLTYWSVDNVGNTESSNFASLDFDRAPVAADDSYSVHANGTLAVPTPGLFANDGDPDGDSFAVGDLQQPAHGVFANFPNDGSFVYVPNPGFVGTDTFSYRVSDGRLLSNWATVTIDVTDQAPVAADDGTFVVHSNGALTVPAPGILGNDSDAEGDPLSVGDLQQPAHGVFANFPNDGSFVYVPNAGFVGTDTFSYRVSDGALLSNWATVTIDVTDQAPTAGDDSYSVHANGSLTVPTEGAPGLFANDLDPDGDPLAVGALQEPTHGVFANFPNDGSFVYVPNAGFVGSDTFMYQVSDGALLSNWATVTINVTDQAPVAVDDTYMVHRDATLTVDKPGLFANDSDPEGDPLSVADLQQPVHGSFANFPNDGSFVYVPDAGFVGTDSFSYRVSDGALLSNWATVTINVMGGADLAISMDGPTGLQPGDTGHYLVTITDTGPDGGVSFTVGSHIFNAQVADFGPATSDFGNCSAGACNFGALAAGASVTADFSFVVFQTAPLGPTMFGVFVFQQNPQDPNSENDVANVSVKIGNRAPVAVDDSYTTPPGQPLTFDPLKNDYDPDGDPFAIHGFQQPSNGTLAQLEGGGFLYTPNGSFTGTDSFTYQIFDGLVASDPATVTIDVGLPAPSAPDLEATDDSGVSNVDNVTNVAQPHFDVYGLPGLLTELLENAEVIGSAYADETGLATIAPAAPFADGIHVVAARQVASDGADGSVSDSLSVAIDTQAPQLVWDPAFTQGAAITIATGSGLPVGSQDSTFQFSLDQGATWQTGPYVIPALGVYTPVSGAEFINWTNGGAPNPTGTQFESWVYYRATFTLASTFGTSLAVDVSADNGASFFLNGSAVGSWDTFTSLGHLVDSNSSHFVVGQNTLEIRVLNVGDSGLSATDQNFNPTALSFTANVSAPSAYDGQWTNQVVVQPYETSDDLSGLADASPPSPLYFVDEGAGQGVDVVVTDNAGNSATYHTPTPVNIDLTPPSIVALRSVAPNQAGWNNTPVTVTFDCSDALSGLGSCSDPQTFGDGADQSASGFAMDAAGNSAYVTEGPINVALNPPELSLPQDVTAEAKSPDGAVVTYDAATAVGAGPVTITYSQESGTQFALGTTTVTVTATDAAGNTSTGTFNVTVVDTTPPTTTLSPDPSERLFAGPTTFTLTATDNATGVAATYFFADDGGVQTYDGPITLNFVGQLDFTYWSVDVAGNHEQQHHVLLHFVNPLQVTASQASMTEGIGSSAQLATIAWAGQSATSDQFSATIDWGDGSSSAGTITGSGDAFTVSGFHSYDEEGTHSATVHVTGPGETSADTPTSIAVADAPLTAAATNPFTVNEGTSTGTLPLVTFSDGDPDAAVTDYTATIDWGDGTTSTGTITVAPTSTNLDAVAICECFVPARFIVSGTHTYLNNTSDGDPYTVTITISDAGGSTTSATLSATVNNVAPAITSLTPSPDKPKVGSPATLNGTFTDPGTQDTHTVTIDWGDQTTHTVVNLAANVLTFSSDHTYSKPGEHTITATLTDDFGGSSSQTTKVTVQGQGVPLLPRIDLGVGGSVAPGSDGNSLVFHFSVTNGGSSTAHGAELHLHLPAGASVVSVTASQGSCQVSGQNVDCSFGDMGPGGSASVDVVVTSTSNGSVTISGSVASHGDEDINPLNDSTSVTGQLSAPYRLTIIITATPQQVGVGDWITYTIVVTNLGPGAAENVKVTDPLPDSVDFVSCTTSQGSCGGGARTLAAGGTSQANLGHMDSGKDATVTIVGRANKTGTTQNSASTNGDGSATQTSSTSTTVVESSFRPPADVPPPVLFKSVDAGPVSGVVKYRKPGTNTWIVLKAGQQLPLGVEFDTTAGHMILTTAKDATGAVQTVEVWGGFFVVSQITQSPALNPPGPTPIPYAVLTLTRGDTSACGTGTRTLSSLSPDAKTPPKRRSKNPPKKRKTAVTRKLWGRGHGNFQTKGHYSSAAVRGTYWLTEDRCDGTFTQVVEGVVAVTDFTLHKTVLVTAGHSYLAKKP